MNAVPEWRLAGDWFDICSCNIPCPCEFAQPPTNNSCQGMLVWHIKQGRFGDVQLDGFNLLALGGFEGNLWAGAPSWGFSSTKERTSGNGRRYRPSSPAKEGVGRQALRPPLASFAV